jgi:hypothetical protein
VEKRHLNQRRGSVSPWRRHATGERLIRALGLAGLWPRRIPPRSASPSAANQGIAALRKGSWR